MIDPEYLGKLIKFINQRDNVRYKISDLSTDPPKMVEHIKYYIDNRALDMLDVEFMGDKFEEFRIIEFFEGIVKQQQHNTKKLQARL